MRRRSLALALLALLLFPGGLALPGAVVVPSSPEATVSPTADSAIQSTNRGATSVAGASTGLAQAWNVQVTDPLTAELRLTWGPATAGTVGISIFRPDSLEDGTLDNSREWLTSSDASTLTQDGISLPVDPEWGPEFVVVARAITGSMPDGIMQFHGTSPDAGETVVLILSA